MRRSLITLFAALTCLSAVTLSGSSASAESPTASTQTASAYAAATQAAAPSNVSAMKARKQRVASGALPGLRYVAIAPRTARVGEQIVVKTSWRDRRGTVYADLQDWGDLGIGSSRPPICEPGERTTRGDRGRDRLTHTWSAPGTYTVRLQVTSGGCGIASQTRTVKFKVVVS